MSLYRTACDTCGAPLGFTLEHGWRHSLADVADAVPETDEPPLCACGRHYIGASCQA